MNTFSILEKKSLVLVFAFAPAGLGHLRVTDALYRGLPEEITPVLLGTQDKSISWIHRFISIHPITRAMFEVVQRGWLQDIAAYVYRLMLRSHTKLLYQQLTTILDERIDLPQTILIVATHFGLAHQLAEIKGIVEKKRQVRIILVVQVTDDSPHPIWYVDGADIIFVPSFTTREKLVHFGKTYHIPPVNFEVLAYPVSPDLTRHLTHEQLTNRKDQLDPEKKSHIHVSVPISGAAVGTTFVADLIDNLHQISERFLFHIVVKDAPYTKNFLGYMLDKPFVQLHVSSHDRGTVNNYDLLFHQTTISLEITKPSEQAFKCLCNPTQRGGTLLLFSNPVGQQERDNLEFLRRHHLIPGHHIEQELFEKARMDDPLQNQRGQELLAMASAWRGLVLPFHSKPSAQFITWCERVGIFGEMVKCRIEEDAKDGHVIELTSTGVHLFWEHTAQYLTSHPLA